MTIHLLVVSDDKELASLLERSLLSKNGDFSISYATSAQDAVRLLEEGEYDAILADFHLGQDAMSGLELLEWLRDAGNDVLFILFTGRSREEIAIRALNLGADFYLRKDEADFQSLASEIAQHIRSSVNEKRMEQALIESESKFRNLFEESLDGIIATDIKGIITQSNSRFADMLGYTMQELVGMSFRDLSPVTWHTTMVQVGIEVQENGFSRVYEQDLLTSDGREVPVAISSWRMDGPDGKPTGAWVIIRDISLRKSSEKALRVSEAKFRALFEDIPTSISLYDPDGNLIDANAATCQMFGVSVNSILGYNLFQDPDLPEDVKSSLKQGDSVTFQRDYDFSSVMDRNLYATSKVGKSTFSVTAAPFGKTETGQIIGYMFIINQIKE